MQRFSKKSRKSRPNRVWLAYPLLGLLWFGIGIAHKSKMPQDLDDICVIFEERRDWYEAAQASESRWGTPAPIQMAIIRQESSFRFDARPPRTTLLGVIPWKRPSNAYGFAQALEGTWARYQQQSGRQFADRDDFADAIDFVGWYTNLSNTSESISKWDPYNQYLAFHEGQAGWRAQTFKEKRWLVKTAQKVETRARHWSAQLHGCRENLDDPFWMFSGVSRWLAE